MHELELVGIYLHGKAFSNILFGPLGFKTLPVLGFLMTFIYMNVPLDIFNRIFENAFTYIVYNSINPGTYLHITDIYMSSGVCFLYVCRFICDKRI